MAADVILLGGDVISHPGQSMVAIKSGSIVAVGADHEASALAGPATRIIRLQGRTVMPAFQDAHIHPSIGGLAMLRCDLHQVRGVDSLIVAIKRYADDHPDLPWIVGAGWHSTDFELGSPSRELLDVAVPDRPAFMMNNGVHDGWVNSAALAAAGIDRNTPDPPFGRIERTATKEPQGTLHEAAVRLVEARLPPTTRNELERAILLAQKHLHSLGITAWQDAWVTPDVLDAYRSVANRHELTARVVAALWWERNAGPEQIDWMRDARADNATGHLRATSVKIMQDGTIGNFTAAVLEPYLDPEGRPTDNRGMSFVDPSDLHRYAAALDREGFQIHFHAIGERAVREALNALETVRNTNPPLDNRHHISHVSVVHPDDVSRFASLGIVANIQPFWAVDGEEIRVKSRFLGAERAAWWYPFASIARHGARLAAGSDWSVSTANPFEEIEVAVSRVDPSLRGAMEPLLPNERLSVTDALHAFTSGSAYVNHLDQTGAIEVGMWADLVVANRSIVQASEQPIGTAKVLMTMVDGETVYSDPTVEW
ncbi:MAG: amidohydrolase [Thermomicrobiales bacterium]|nr:MAG: amidohydrolase [Thermomicrobiales bacterium]